MWNCQLSKNANITVGEKVVLSCAGSLDEISSKALTIKAADLSDEIPALTLLDVQSLEPSNLKFVVTSYRVGDHTSQEVVFYDGQKKIPLSGFEWKTVSVLKEDPTHPPQAYGAYPLWKLSYPLWFWIILFLCLCGAIILPYLQFRKLQQRKKSFEDLKNLETALNPLDAFFKSVRRMERALEVGHVSPKGFAEQIDKDLKIFLSRSLQIPVHLWTLRQTLKEIKKTYPKLYRDHGEAIKKYFSEFAKISKNLEKKDCLYLMERAQKLTEMVDAALSKKRGSR